MTASAGILQWGALEPCEHRATLTSPGLPAPSRSTPAVTGDDQDSLRLKDESSILSTVHHHHLDKNMKSFSLPKLN